MSRFIDKFFSVLPFILIFYHTVNISKCFSNIPVLVKITINYLISIALKNIFRKMRRIKTYDHKDWNIPRILSSFKMNYSFPSSHAMFFVKYAFLFPGALVIILCVIGIISRVFYQHHTVNEVLFAAFVVCVIEIIHRVFF